MSQLAFHTTRSCCQHSHPEIVIPLDAASGLTPEWLIQYFESAVRDGKVFKPGERVQIGGGLVKLQEGQPGTLELWEPDFSSMPIKWVQGVSETLRQLILQKSVAELVGEQPDFASILHAGQVPEGWSGLSVFEMHRNAPEESHTGWSIERADKPPTQLVSIYDIGRQLPVCLPFFALPAGAQVEISPERIHVEFAGRSASSEESALLKGLLAAASH